MQPRTTQETLTSLPKLPVELIHCIVDFVGDRMDDDDDDDDDEGSNYPSDIAACSLVCRAWNDVCRPQIFRVIVVEQSTNFRSRFSFLHFEAPHLSEYILELHASWGSNALSAPSWLPDCFNRLKKLRALYLESFIPSSAPTLSPPFGMAIISLISNVELKRLCLKKWDSLEDIPDLLRILSACSTTLEHFTLELFAVAHHGTMPEQTDAEPKVPPVVCLKALRKLELLRGPVQIPQTNRIECPNLKSFIIQLAADDDVWDTPSWIPASLSELILKVHCTSRIPQARFGQSIRPSDVTIHISGLRTDIDTYLSLFTWIGNCIGRFPSPSHLRRLTVKACIFLYNESDLTELSYPRCTDYEALSQCLVQLYEHGNLESINLSVELFLASDLEIDPDVVRAREGPKFTTGFAPLLSADRFFAEVLVRRAGSDGKPLVRCST